MVSFAGGFLFKHGKKTTRTSQPSRSCPHFTSETASPQGRLPHGILDEEAVLVVSRALGHNRRDVVLTSYLR
ncbi:hypothetical protein KSD_55990 [Ktedonobacter sp. SOSP1-85]|uniref:hypothetical protein n=1 Tax=Ktedonobacter sp. SOSP1-85 TaxID=2778367 RepID=UPI001A1CE374|nr:hypothetical protein [Ktedonobacter sp. SOSP1-85]GHO77828.1 hypothetical protein KSD_55990 [Ktedonobacter sp. SOSP1-85]